MNTEPPTAANSTQAPIELVIRMYQVGFGDCFLLTLRYAAPLDDGRRERHVLIDFGSTRLAPGLQDLRPIAREINRHTGGGLLDVVAVTHRHRDHMSAFGVSKVVDALVADGFPRLVIRSWTEDPVVARDATGARPGNRAGAVGERSLAFIRTLEHADAFATRLHETLEAATRNSFAGSVADASLDQITNRAAVETLIRWGERDSEYLHYGVKSRLAEFVPGLGVHVLGPPTIDQHEAVRTQRHSDPDEFWQLYARALGDLPFRYLAGAPRGAGRAARAPSRAFGYVEDAVDPELKDVSEGYGPVGPVRWLTERLGRQQLNSLYRIVRILDDVLNNTSLILLFEVPTAAGPLRLLFGGDAQIENWEYALKFAVESSDNSALLAAVDVYKVGHHGSRNATPRTLFNLWLTEDNRERPMTGLMSTKSTVHSGVPRPSLVSALGQRLTLYSTETLTDGARYVELSADLTRGKQLSAAAFTTEPNDPDDDVATPVAERRMPAAAI